MDLKVRQWSGNYPAGLNVDELWVLAVDAERVVTFSAYHTWKSRWPPFQSSSRIADVSFRGIRNNYFGSEQEREYTAITHIIARITGAVGMLHRNFWPDLYLCMADRYAGYLGHFQYRLHRAPITKLVMDLIACQEELNIVIQITEQQLDTISTLQSSLEEKEAESDHKTPSPTTQRQSPTFRRAPTDDYTDFNEIDQTRHFVFRRSNYHQLSTSHLSDPAAQLLENLTRELVDLRDLHTNTDRLINRTIQLVNIRLEDHGKAILVFTVMTMIFLPLNSVSSFFGMIFADIRDMEKTQCPFWAVAICVTTGVVGASVFLAFSGGPLLEKIHSWRGATRKTHAFTMSSTRQIFENSYNDNSNTNSRMGILKVRGTNSDGWRRTR